MLNNSVLKNRLKDCLSNGQKEWIRRGLRFCFSIFPANQSMDTIALKYGTDKWTHGYIEFYKKYFYPLRKRMLKILEIGVGGYSDPKAGGASLRVWQEFFPNSLIYAIDLEDKSYHEDKRIKIFRGSQDAPEFMKKVASDIGKLDIIIDDGSHINEHVTKSFRTLFPFLMDGGIYVIEDLHTSYWPHYGGNWINLNDPMTTMSMLKDLADGLNYEYIPDKIPGYFEKNVSSIHLYPKIAFIFKGENKHNDLNYIKRDVEKAKGIRH